MKNVITDFGATGNGSTDDTTAIQNALNACSSGGANPGVQLLFPAGTYKITGTLNLTYSNYNLVGEGPSASVISYFGANGTLTGGIFLIPGSGTQSDFRMAGLRITSNTPGGSRYGVVSSGAGTLSGLKLTNCKIDSCWAGIRMANVMDQCVIDGCEFTANTLASYTGVDPSNADINGTFTNTVVKNCYIHDTGQASNLNHTIYMNGGCQNVAILNNTWRNIAHDALEFGGVGDGFSGTTGNTGLTYSNNTFNNVSGAAGLITNTTGATVTNNSVVSCNDGFTFYGTCFGWTCSGNSVTYVGTLAAAQATRIAGICTVAQGASNGVISNNTACYTHNYDTNYYAYGNAITVNQGSDLEIFGNTVTGYNLGVAILANNSPGTSRRINVHDNSFSILDGAVDNTAGHGSYSYTGNSGDTVGVAVNADTQDVYAYSNHFRNLTVGVVISNYSLIGPVAAAYTTAKVSVMRNRFYNVTVPLWLHPSVTATNVAFDNNFGGTAVKTDGKVVNLRMLNNSPDGSFWSTPGSVGNQTNL